MKRCLRFYQQVFGMRETFRLGNDMVFLNTPGSKDMITLHKDSDAAEIAGTSGGIAHFGFILIKSDLDAAIAEVRKAGGKLLERGEHSPGYPYAYVTDPDGYVIEL
jgi:catechol 2,3-dioxygenase-like lactoylglutathione lyase family enzyme